MDNIWKRTVAFLSFENIFTYKPAYHFFEGKHIYYILYIRYILYIQNIKIKEF